ncbi:hypothetical protein T492DRAFT_836527 [Pavlovales sp. CCMP2436]|nr:hypothetical protein T492DRAFT_836527 [Pavlovales sp. CCMP2436]
MNFQSIVLMAQFETTSFEELRFADYTSGNKGTGPVQPSAAAGSSAAIGVASGIGAQGFFHGSSLCAGAVQAQVQPSAAVPQAQPSTVAGSFAAFGAAGGRAASGIGAQGFFYGSLQAQAETPQAASREQEAAWECETASGVWTPFERPITDALEGAFLSQNACSAPAHFLFTFTRRARWRA